MAKKKADGAPSKMAMVREVLAELGSDAKPLDMAALVKSKFGVDISPQMLSAYKATINKKGGGGGRGKRGGGGGDMVSVRDLTAIQVLVGRYGVDGLGKLAKALS